MRDTEKKDKDYLWLLGWCLLLQPRDNLEGDGSLGLGLNIGTDEEDLSGDFSMSTLFKPAKKDFQRQGFCISKVMALVGKSVLFSS